MTGADAVAQDVQGLAHLGLPALRAEWRRRWGDPPEFRSRDFLLRAATYRVQIAAWGDLSAPTKRRAAEMAEKFTADRAFTPVVGPSLKPGSSLIREWRGERHEVAVTDEGFSYRDEAFGSLSQVAHRITGVKWNGLVFFGLKPRGGKGA